MSTQYQDRFDKLRFGHFGGLENLEAPIDRDLPPFGSLFNRQHLFNRQQEGLSLNRKLAGQDTGIECLASTEHGKQPPLQFHVEGPNRSPQKPAAMESIGTPVDQFHVQICRGIPQRIVRFLIEQMGTIRSSRGVRSHPAFEAGNSPDFKITCRRSASPC